MRRAVNNGGWNIFQGRETRERERERERDHRLLSGEGDLARDNKRAPQLPELLLGKPYF